MCKKRIFRKFSVVAAILSMSLFFWSTPAVADMGITYEQKQQEYGENIENFQTKAVNGERSMNVLFIQGMEGKTYTASNVRSFPSTEKSIITTVPEDVHFKIWGIAENDWLKVYGIDQKGERFFGYIHGSLLVPIV